MFGFNKKKTNKEKKEEEEREDKTLKDVALSKSIEVAEKNMKPYMDEKYQKPDRYTGNRKLFDSSRKQKYKDEVFKNNRSVKDRATNKELVKEQAEAKKKYGDKWSEHAAETDHMYPTKKMYDKDIPFFTNDDRKNIVDNPDNFEVVSRKINNAKRDRSKEEFYSDEGLLKERNIKIPDKRRKELIDEGKKNTKNINKKIKRAQINNIKQDFHETGVKAAKEAGASSGIISGIRNMVSVVKGEKTVKEALMDTAEDSGKAGAKSYVTGGGTRIINHTLSNKKSVFLNKLAENNVPGKVITAIMVTGNTIKKWGNGEISTREGIEELGENGLGFLYGSYGFTIGTTLIEGSLFAGAIGCMIGTALMSKYCNDLLAEIKNRKMDHEEKMRIIAEYKEAARVAREYREELEAYLEGELSELKGYLDAELSAMDLAYEMGDADSFIVGANEITRRLGGEVQYETVEEYKTFLDSDEDEWF